MIYTLGRFVVGMIIGFFGVTLFTDNAHAAVVAAVLCGVVVDQLFRSKV